MTLAQHQSNMCLLDRFWLPGKDMSLSVVPGLWRCLASPGNFIYGREEAYVHRHVTSMPVVIRSTNYFLGQFIGSTSEGEYNTVNNTTSVQVTGHKSTSHKHSPLVPTRANKIDNFHTYIGPRGGRRWPGQRIAPPCCRFTNSLDPRGGDGNTNN